MAAVQYGTVLYCTVQYSTVQYTFTQNNTMKQNTQNGTYITIRIHELTTEYITIHNIQN